MRNHKRIPPFVLILLGSFLGRNDPIRTPDLYFPLGTTLRYEHDLQARLYETHETQDKG